ncbi:hypothetical protein PHYSODRAFT_263966 [Phytophthora sojae]|uniref:Uncharacterized protein n=1 Tax=Phytophthora sojae (strain P6497) TaxID=1094619 RepID=G4YLI0_PHYSP|nr:hypothetical protein PHYSODRAFT_263966 [Phytophthora sojae]EGZ30354.1 hypothetical protein PHYSODRAFT_263966 [Phytophthora sojae]|eukprot:XP_009517629.1 hypothetical protein PHYSODRAFT_263966 [Phytophthora sojae]
MATHGAQGEAPEEQGRRTGLRPRKTVDYLQAAQGYTKDDEGDEDYVKEEMTPDIEEEIGVEEVEKDDEEANDTKVESVEDEEEVKGVEDEEEAKSEEMAGISAMSAVEHAVGPNEQHVDDDDLFGDDDDDTTATHVTAKSDGGMAAAVIDDDDLFGGEDDKDTDAVAEDNDKGAGSKRKVTGFEKYLYARPGKKPKLKPLSKRRAPAEESYSTKAQGASPSKRAKVGRKENEQAAVTSASDQPPPRHRERRRTKTWEER